jgi:hypothetical protein
LNRFVGLNGLGQIGRDKRILLTGSAVSLGAALVLAPATGAVWGLALASLVGASVLAISAGRATQQLENARAGPAATWPTLRETAGLVLLNLCGYLNMGTDVLMANHLLPGAQAISYAFWSRGLMSACLLTGMYCQIRFPKWATTSPQALRHEMQLGWLFALSVPVLAVPTYAVVNMSRWADTLCLLPWWMLAVLACNYGVCCVVLVAGQISIARSTYGFLIKSSMLACLAPVLAGGLAWLSQPAAFVFGYFSVSVALAVVNARHALLSLRIEPTH